MTTRIKIFDGRDGDAEKEVNKFLKRKGIKFKDLKSEEVEYEQYSVALGCYVKYSTDKITLIYEIRK